MVMCRTKWMFGILVVLALIGLGIGSHWFFAAQARKSPAWRYVARALEKSVPDYDLRNCVDLDAKDRKDFTDKDWRPLPCINTATSIYNPDFRAGNCAKFVRNPAKWGFREVGAHKAVPGDMIIFFKKNGYARHAAIYMQDSLLGPLCATTVLPRWGYYHYFPYKIALCSSWFIDSFSSVKYYRYSGAVPPR